MSKIVKGLTRLASDFGPLVMLSVMDDVNQHFKDKRAKKRELAQQQAERKHRDRVLANASHDDAAANSLNSSITGARGTQMNAAEATRLSLSAEDKRNRI